ncbi:MAG: P-loop NTPase fold protein [Mariniblastus sp.]
MLKRWIDVAHLSVFGTLLAAVLLFFSEKIGDWFVERNSLDGVGGAIFLLTVLGLLFALLLKAPIRKAHLFSSFRYPSVWIGVILAIAGAHFSLTLLPWLMPGWSKWPSQTSLFLAELAFGIPFLFVWGNIAIQEWNASAVRTNGELESKLNKMAELEDWIASEKPVFHPNFDYLNRSDIARRMAVQVLDGKDQTIGLSGGFGTGKSSLIELMMHFLPEQETATGKTAIVSRVSCWGFENSDSALRYILASAIEKLGEHVDVVAFEDLPETYVDLLSGSGNWFSALIGQFSNSMGPEEKLRRLTPVLQAINAKLIIVVEDLDRNNSHGFDRQQVLATLNVIRDVPDISFVLAGGRSGNDSLSFTRLCDQIEVVPSLTKERTYEILNELSESSLAKYADINVNENSGGSFSTNPLLKIRYYGLPELQSWEFAVIKLVKTPRNLKHSLRKTLFDWSSLHGEVVFEELLMMNVLRMSAPMAFDFILEHYDGLAFEEVRGDLTNSKEHEAKREAFLSKQWEKKKSSPEEWDDDSALLVLRSLFPGKKNSIFSHGGSYSVTASPQAMGGLQNKRYFQRIVSGQCGVDEVRDQFVIQTINDFKQSGDSKNMTGLMLGESEYSSLWERFAYMIDRSQLLSVASMVFEACLQRYGNKASGREEGGLAVWREALSRPSDSAGDWICKELKKSCAVSLQFTNDIFYFWASERNSIAHFGQIGELRERARQTMVRCIKEQYVGEPRKLAEFVDGSERSGYELCHLIFVDTDPAPLNEARDWAFLANTLVDAAELSPEIILPRVLHLIENREQSSQTMIGLKPDVINDFFGSQAQRMMQFIFDQHRILNENQDFDEKRVETLAAEWLETHNQ